MLLAGTQHLRGAEPWSRRGVGARAQSLAGHHRAGQNDGGHFLRRGVDGMALQQVGLPQVALHRAEVTAPVPTAARTRPQRAVAPASGRNKRRSNSSKTSHGRRWRRLAQELSASDWPVNSNKCSARVPTSCMTWKIRAGSSVVNGIRGGRPRPSRRTGRSRPPTNPCHASRNPTGRRAG
jgi:hypothetical protein